MKNLVYGIVGFGLEVINGINAINQIDNKVYTTTQNKCFAGCGMVAGILGGMYLGIYIQKAYDEKKRKEAAKK